MMVVITCLFADILLLILKLDFYNIYKFILLKFL